MALKRKSILIIAVSSFVITSVLVLTIFGFYAYLEWKEKNIRRSYRLALHELNGELFKKYVIITLQPKIAGEGVFQGKPVVAGTIKNTSNKSIYSLRMKVSFCDRAQRVVYVDTFYPIGAEPDSLIDRVDTTTNFLREGDSLSFTHHLKNCPPEVMSHLGSKLKFAKRENVSPLDLRHVVEELDIR